MRWSLRTRLRDTYRAAIGSSAYRSILFANDALAVAGIRRASDRSAGHVVICPPGGGNIGDAAMVEAVVAQSEGSLTLICQADEAFPSAADSPHVRTVVEHGFLRALPGFRMASTRRVARLIAGASQVSVVGADLMDGAYNVTSSLSRVSALRMAVHWGVPGRVLGFSFATVPRRTLVEALRGLNGAADLCVRDPASLRRLRELGVDGTRQVADVVFTQQDYEVPAECANLAHMSDGSTFAVVNASGLISSRLPSQAEEYGAVIAALKKLVSTIVLVPHVLTRDRSDVAVLREIVDRWGTEQIVLIERQLEPREVRGLARDAEVVVTGRMHLAVMALGQNTPALTLATQGKVEGLYELFGLRDAGLVWEPTVGFGDRLADRIAKLQVSAVSRQISSKVVSVRAAADLNFDSPRTTDRRVRP